MKISLRLLVVSILIFMATWSFASQTGSLSFESDQIDSTYLADSSIAFSGWLLVTNDQDWREKWDTPEQAIPRFNETDEVRLGEKITILTFYRNPLPDENGMINISCDLTITKPDGSLSYQQENMECANEILQGNPHNLRLTYVIIDFIGEIGDPYGRWTVEVNLKDENRGVEIPLQTYFELINTSRFTWWQPFMIGAGFNE